MKRVYLIAIVICLFSCSKQVSTIDDALQNSVESILSDKLKELNALSGQVIVMETKTGEIKAMVGLERKDSTYQLCNDFIYRQETGLMHPISLLAILESEMASISDSVDTGNGEYLIKNAVMRDHNWKRGGYGSITLEQAIMTGSNIAITKTIEKVYGENPQTYFDALERMKYGKPDSINGLPDLKPVNFVTPNHSAWNNDNALTWFSIGYYQQISPIQVLTFYNAIANNGVMVLPQLCKGSTTIINPQIASKENIVFIKQAFERTVSNGLGQPAYSDKVNIAGNPGTVHLGYENGIDKYGIEFCGYFPADNPEYTVIVSIDKVGLPASGGLMAGDVFKKIVSLYIEQE